jgi:hypothetical protein
MKKMAFHRGWSSPIILVLGLFLMTAFLASCENDNIFSGLSDKDTKEAHTEEALMAMDDGDYRKAISILEDLTDEYPNDAQLWQYLSSAHSGAAGLDTLNLMEVLDDLEEMDESGSIDMIGLVLGDADGTLTADEIAEKLEEITTAIESIRDNVPNPDEDQTILLGLLSITHLSLTLADMIIQDTGATAIELTEDGISDLYGGTPADFTGLADTATLDAVNDDIAAINDAVDVLNDLSGDNDMAEDFSDFQNDIDPNGNGDVTQSELENYVDTIGS